MHQTHNIPWHMLCCHLKVRPEHNRSIDRQWRNYMRDPQTPATPPREDRVILEPRGRPAQARELHYFVTAFVRTIRDFSATERAKHPPAEHLKQKPERHEFVLFSPATAARFNDLYTGNEANDFLREQLLKHLHNNAMPPPPDTDLSSFLVTSHATSSHNRAQAAEVIKLLFELDALGQLLRLAHHPDLRLEDLLYCTGSHFFGFYAMVEEALWMYLFLNVVGSYPNAELVRGGAYRRTWAFGFLERSMGPKDFNAQSVPHVRFWHVEPDSTAPPWKRPDQIRLFGEEEEMASHGEESLGVRNSAKGVCDGNRSQSSGGRHSAEETAGSSKPRMMQMKQYLGLLFRLLYQFDVVMRERGIEPDWETLLVEEMRHLFGFETAESVEDCAEKSPVGMGTLWGIDGGLRLLSASGGYRTRRWFV